MKTEFLKSLGLDDDVIARLQAESGKDVEAEKVRTKAVQDELNRANGRIADYERQIGDLKSIDAAGMQKKIQDLEKQISDRKAADDEAIREKNYTERFDKVTDGKKYLNDFTRKGIYEEFKAALMDDSNSGKHDSDVFRSLIKDREGIFVSANPAVDVPGLGNGDASKIDDNQVRAVMGLPPVRA